MQDHETQDFDEMIASLDSIEELDEDLEQARLYRRAKRREQMKREKERYLRRMKLLKIGIPCGIVLLIVCIFIVRGSIQKKHKELDNQSFPVTVQENDAFKNVDSEMSITLEHPNQTDETTDDSVTDSQDSTTDEFIENPIIEDTVSTSPNVGNYKPTESANMAAVNGEVISEAAIVINRGTNEIICTRDAYARISPASMTKILTVLVAAEHVKDLNDTFTMTRDITDYGYLNDCSSAGFLENEVITIKDLFYGTILPSGADAGVGLATYVAGSHEAFVEMMNQKIAELGLSNSTHFTNCVGIYDEQHYSTVYDMAIILEAAMDNDICREVLNARSYQTSITEQHPEGIIISNWFLRRIEDKDTHGNVIGAKTGYVVQSKNCAASCLKDNTGNEYICVTAGSSSSWRCIYDHVALYQQLVP